MMIYRYIYLFIAMFGLALSTWANEDFLIPNLIRHDMDFWAKVYREWDIHQAIFYDAKTKVIYDVLDLPTVANELSIYRYKKDVEKRLKAIKDILKNINSKKDDPLVITLKKHGIAEEQDLLDRLKVQSGLRSQFEQGLMISGRYMDDIKAILTWQKLPEDLMAMIFVESLFNLSSVSHAGAVGPWGIVKETALRSGIHVNNFTDERLDWVMATYGAAQFINRAKEGLLEWPLVITAYNYGYPGMMRAAGVYGHDFEAIIKNHVSPIFGYASKSYYAEFLAALDTIKHQDKYFPHIKKEARLVYDTVKVDKSIEVNDLLSLGVLSKEEFRKFNPAITNRTLAGHEVLPLGYSFRIPLGKSHDFYHKVKKIDHKKLQHAAQKISIKHKARPKETLLKIAKKYNILPTYLSEKLSKPLDYQPKGMINIRSEAHNFSSLISINNDVLLK